MACNQSGKIQSAQKILLSGNNLYGIVESLQKMNISYKTYKNSEINFSKEATSSLKINSPFNTLFFKENS